MLTLQCLQKAVQQVESSFDLAPSARQRTLWRLDGGAGTDDNLKRLLKRDYQVLAKGYSGRRANALARRVNRWHPERDNSWLGPVEPTFELGRPIDVIVRKRQIESSWRHSYYVTTAVFPSIRALMQSYDARGGAETVRSSNFGKTRTVSTWLRAANKNLRRRLP